MWPLSLTADSTITANLVWRKNCQFLKGNRAKFQPALNHHNVGFYMEVNNKNPRSENKTICCLLKQLNILVSCDAATSGTNWKENLYLHLSIV